ncbi:alpha/beta hydrolase [Nonomuraea sp. NPDC047529]|uniref:alpha/beta fold hydrolase n=1 Tax=Nonomuraea sp. NPDC047529 TaxID=3155623 RepID=UPI0033E369D8
MSRAPLRPGTHTVALLGIPHRYHVAGSGPLCIVHPGGPGLGWEYLRMPEVEEHLTLVYLEPAGTGGSGHLATPNDYRITTYTAFLSALVEHLGAQEAFLIGHSHGGFVAQTYALTHPAHLTGLILYDTSPVTGQEFWEQALANLNRLPQRHPEAATIPQAFQQTLAATDNASATAGLRAVLPAYFADYWAHERELAPLRATIRAWIDPLRSAEPPFDVRHRLPEISTPTLVVSGAHDFICGPRWGRMLHEGIPGSRLLLLEASGHLGHLEEPDIFARTVTEFVLRTAAGDRDTPPSPRAVLALPPTVDVHLTDGPDHRGGGLGF